MIKIPNRKDKHVPKNSIKRLHLDANGIDEDGHYDETKDHTFMKRFKKEYPESYKEFCKIMGMSDNS